MGKLEKFVGNLKLLLNRNKNNIVRLIVSEPFIEKISKTTEPLDLSENTDTGEWYFFGVPVVVSSLLKDDAILEMVTGEFMVLKGI